MSTPIKEGDMTGTFDFLRQLSENNNRPWFKEHKEHFDSLREHWFIRLQQLIDAMTKWDGSFAGITAKQATYRIYRDTRFSLDKTPYKTYFSASVTPHNRRHKYGGYYIELGPGPNQCGLYGGLWCPDSRTLTKLRKAIVDNREEWEEILSDPQINKLYPGWCGSSLKTIPKGWNKDHPLAEYLRLKDYGKCHRPDNGFFNDPCWPEHAAELFRHLKPLVDFLNYSIDEDV